MSGWARPGSVVLVAGAALAALATTLPGSASVGVGSASVTPRVTDEPVRSAAVTCPGPETEGIAGVAPVPGAPTTVLAAAAPQEALFGLPTAATEDAALTVRTLPDGSTPAATTVRGTTVTASLSGPTSAEVSATGPLAAGLSALQTTLRRDGDDRGLQTLLCSAPTASAFLLGGGADTTRRERLVVANPGRNPVTVDVVVYGAKGPLAAPGPRLRVPAEGRVGLLLDSLATGERAPAVQVVVAGGAVTAVLEDSWIDGAVGRGRDDSAPTAAPATEQVVPAAVLDGPAQLRLLVPGSAEAVVQSRLLTPQGPAPLPADSVVRVPGGTVRDVDLDAVPAGAYAVHVRADQPVVAAVLAQRRPAGAGASELGWAAATEPVSSVAGSPLPSGVSATLSLVATRAGASATVATVAGDGAVSTRPVSVGADSVATVDVTGARSVWVRRTEGTLRAGLALRGTGAGDPLLSLVGLAPAAVTTTSVPVRAVQR